jgi:hypothetical protein
MSVARTTVRLIATAVASVALVGAAAMPALADGHDGDHNRSYSHSHSNGAWRDHGRDHGRFGHWDRGRHHTWYGNHGRDRDRLGRLLRELGHRHYWQADRYRHDHHIGRR